MCRPDCLRILFVQGCCSVFHNMPCPLYPFSFCPLLEARLVARGSFIAATFRYTGRQRWQTKVNVLLELSADLLPVVENLRSYDERLVHAAFGAGESFPTSDSRKAHCELDLH